MSRSHSALSTQYSVFSIPRRAAAQAVVEYAIVFPLQLMLTLGIIQLAHLFIAKQMCEYAAFCGARAVRVGLEDDEARRAAMIPIAKIAGSSGVDSDDSARDIELPGWGRLPNTAAAYAKTPICDFPRTYEDDVTIVHCEIIHWYELQVPIGGAVVGGLAELFIRKDADDADFPLKGRTTAPHIKLKASCALPRPGASAE